MKRRNTFIAMAIAATCWLSSDATRAQSNVLRIGTDVDAQSLDPRVQRETTGFRVINLV
jgi:hypothetical protein